MDRETRGALKRELEHYVKTNPISSVGSRQQIILKLIVDLEQSEKRIAALELVIASARKGENAAEEKLRIARKALQDIFPCLPHGSWQETHCKETIKEIAGGETNAAQTNTDA